MTNPGIVPKLEIDSRTLVSISLDRSTYPIHSFMTVKNNSTLNLVYWKECSIIRPPRWYHWYFCGNCVEVLDHHCKWINWWIGKRNYSYFFLFIAFISVFLLMQILAWIVILVLESKTVNIRIISEMVIFILYLFGFLCFTGHLVIYHIYIIWKGETTREQMKKVYKSKINPYSTSIISNFERMLWANRGKNKLIEPLDMLSLKAPEKTKAVLELEALRKWVSNFW